jgi:hypothetical protein
LDRVGAAGVATHDPALLSRWTHRTECWRRRAVSRSPAGSRDPLPASALVAPRPQGLPARRPGRHLAMTAHILPAASSLLCSFPIQPAVRPDPSRAKRRPAGLPEVSSPTAHPADGPRLRSAARSHLATSTPRHGLGTARATFRSSGLPESLDPGAPMGFALQSFVLPGERPLGLPSTLALLSIGLRPRATRRLRHGWLERLPDCRASLPPENPDIPDRWFRPTGARCSPELLRLSRAFSPARVAGPLGPAPPRALRFRPSSEGPPSPAPQGFDSRAGSALRRRRRRPS